MEVLDEALKIIKPVVEITKAVAQLDQVTQQNSANSSESANAAGTLSSQAEMLNSLVQKLVNTIEGGEEVVLKNGPRYNPVMNKAAS